MAEEEEGQFDLGSMLGVAIVGIGFMGIMGTMLQNQGGYVPVTGEVVLHLKNPPNTTVAPYGGVWTPSLFNPGYPSSQLFSIEQPTGVGLDYEEQATFAVPLTWVFPLQMVILVHKWTSAAKETLDSLLALQSINPGNESNYAPQCVIPELGTFYVNYSTYKIDTEP